MELEGSVLVWSMIALPYPDWFWAVPALVLVYPGWFSLSGDTDKAIGWWYCDYPRSLPHTIRPEWTVGVCWGGVMIKARCYLLYRHSDQTSQSTPTNLKLRSIVAQCNATLGVVETPNDTLGCGISHISPHPNYTGCRSTQSVRRFHLKLIHINTSWEGKGPPNLCQIYFILSRISTYLKWGLHGAPTLWDECYVFIPFVYLRIYRKTI